MAQLFQAVRDGNPPEEVLLEGPAGTGKTRGLLEYCHALACKHANIRILWVRKTLKSLRQSVLVEWEQEVVPNFPWQNSGANRDHRSSYIYPNGTEVVLGGLDHPDRFLSTQYDLIVIFEAHETTLDDWQVLLSRNRNWKLWFQQRICDTNPAQANHWLNKRADTPKMSRFLSRHWHNPRYWNEAKQEWTAIGKAYLATLENLSGARRGRLLDGLWVSAEGQVWPEYDEAIHRIGAKDVPGWDADPTKALPLRWYFASVDWGHSAPGVLQVWGADGEGRIYRVAEIYRTEQQLDWWADRAAELHEEFGLQAIVCDPSRDDCIAGFNKRLNWFRNPRDGQWLARGANNKRANSGKDMGGLDLVRYYMKDPRTGRSRLYLVRDALRFGPDENRERQEKTVCTEDEIPSYVLSKNEEGKVHKDMPDPLCDDHGCDALRYACAFHYDYEMSPFEPAPTFKPGTLGDLLRHDAVTMN